MSDTTETETDTNTNTNTDEPSKAELHERVEQLESTVAKMMPSRRDALRMGAAGIAGAAGLSATSQPADASTGSAGDIGDPNNRPDLFADEIDANQLTGVSTGGIKTKTRAFLSSSSSLSPIPLDSVSYDPDNNFDTSTNEYSVPADGTYLINFQIRLNSTVTSGNKVIVEVNQNGSSQVTVEFLADGGFKTHSSTDVRELTAGDSISLGNRNTRSIFGAEEDTFLSIVRLE